MAMPLKFMTGSATPSVPSPLGHEEVDQPGKERVEDVEEEITTEFLDEDEREKSLLTKVQRDKEIDTLCYSQLFFFYMKQGSTVPHCQISTFFSLQSLKPGIDNSLSSYMNQRSASGEVWRRRWFVLTSQTLVCYENHLVSEYKKMCIC